MGIVHTYEVLHTFEHWLLLYYGVGPLCSRSTGASGIEYTNFKQSDNEMEQFNSTAYIACSRLINK